MQAIENPRPKSKLRKLIVIGGSVALIVLAGLMVQDWHQLWVISSAPDNVPIVAMLFLVPFFTWLGIKQSQPLPIRSSRPACSSALRTSK